MDTADHTTRNRAAWDRQSAEYQQTHGPDLDQTPLAWGVWRIPEAELNVLGEVAGRRILELGCGAAQWSIGLARLGARPVGLDLSFEQLRHAQRLMGAAGVAFTLVQASAEAAPLADASFDIVFCDWGAMTFADPYGTVPEVARLLRPGGRFAFCTGSPIDMVCWNEREELLETTFQRDYFDLRRWEGDSSGTVTFSLPYGAWIRLFRQHSLVVDDLIELRPSEGATSTYRTADDYAWARRWPGECLWQLHRAL